MTKYLWTLVRDFGPPGRSSGSMAYDATRQRIVLCGGIGTASDTWEWDGSYWTQVADSGPSARFGADTAWDDSAKQVLLFGGASADPGQADGLIARGDTWGWDGQVWTQVDDGGPSQRQGLSMASDTSRGRIVLFGGATFQQGQVDAKADTWEWDGNSWTQQDDAGPPARSGHRMAFDALRGRTVLFGGVSADGHGFGDTWEWDGDSWAQVSAIGPGPRVSPSLCFDGKACVLFGGRAMPSTVLGDSWSWDGQFWTQRQDFGPEPRSEHAAAYDDGRDRIVLFGGASNEITDLSETWELRIATG